MSIWCSIGAVFVLKRSVNVSNSLTTRKTGSLRYYNVSIKAKLGWRPTAIRGRLANFPEHFPEQTSILIWKHVPAARRSIDTVTSTAPVATGGPTLPTRQISTYSIAQKGRNLTWIRSDYNLGVILSIRFYQRWQTNHLYRDDGRWKYFV